MENDELVQNMLLELRRGVLSIAVLSQLSKEEYGYSLLKALSDWVYSHPQIVTPFVPSLMSLLLKTNDTSIGSLLRSYVSTKPEGAAELLEVFCSAPETGYSPLTETLRKCLREVGKKSDK